MVANSWRIQLLGRFRVELPEGGEVQILSRKGKALLALLALNDGIALAREELCRQLWPEKPRENQLQSLRQALKELKHAFAPVVAIEASRDSCRLALDSYVCDALECLHAGKNAGSQTLLPEMPEPVFEPYRIELASYAPSGELAEALRGAVALLDWTMGTDPARGLDVLYASRELLPSMPLQVLESTLRRSLAALQGEHSLRNWGETQLAILLMWMGRWEEGINMSKEALGHVRPGKDSAEWTSAVYTAAVFLILRGRFAKARKLLHNATEIAESYGLKEAITRFQHGLAHSYAYDGDLIRALAILDRIPRDESSSLREAHHATYLALNGQASEARTRLEFLSVKIFGVTDARLISQLRVAEAHTLMAEGRGAEARAILEDLRRLCEQSGLTLVSIHATEGLAIVADDADSRARYLREAAAMRERLRFPLLPGDRLRLREVLPESRIHADSRSGRTLSPDL